MTTENDTKYRCTVCGQVGTVGRCCGRDTREPLNDLARAELDAAMRTVRDELRAHNAPLETASGTRLVCRRFWQFEWRNK